MGIRIWPILGLSVQYVLLFRATHDLTTWPSGQRRPGSIPGWALIHFFISLPCNAKLHHTSNMELYKLQKLHSLTFYIELSSKCVGVGLNLALLKDN